MEIRDEKRIERKKRVDAVENMGKKKEETNRKWTKIFNWKKRRKDKTKHGYSEPKCDFISPFEAYGLMGCAS